MGHGKLWALMKRKVRYAKKHHNNIRGRDSQGERWGMRS